MLLRKKTGYPYKLLIGGFDNERVLCITFSGIIIDDLVETTY